MMAHEEFRKASFVFIARGLSRGNPEVSMTPEIRQALRQHLVQGQLANRAGFDFDEIFGNARDEIKRILLKELYQDLVKAGLQDHLAKIFRLNYLKNATLPPRIVESFPVDQRPLVQAQLLRSYKLLSSVGTFDPTSESFKLLSRLTGAMRRMQLSTPMCEGLF